MNKNIFAGFFLILRGKKCVVSLCISPLSSLSCDPRKLASLWYLTIWPSIIPPVCLPRGKTSTSVLYGLIFHFPNWGPVFFHKHTNHFFFCVKAVFNFNLTVAFYPHTRNVPGVGVLRLQMQRTIPRSTYVARVPHCGRTDFPVRFLLCICKGYASYL